MTRQTCDICQREVSEKYGLTELLFDYKIEGVSEVCSDCEKSLKEFQRKVREWTDELKNATIRRGVMALVQRWRKP